MSGTPKPIRSLRIVTGCIFSQFTVQMICAEKKFHISGDKIFLSSSKPHHRETESNY